MMRNQKTLISALSLSVALTMSTAIVDPVPVHAFDFKKSTSKFKKKFKKNTRKIKKVLKNPKTKRLIQGAGVALVLGGAIKESRAAAIIGVALVAAPEIFKKDIAKSYGNDLAWSSCTRCGNRRPQAVVVPGRKVSAKTKKTSITRVKEDVKDIQQALQTLGLYKKKIDGDFGPGTRAGVKEFQVALGDNDSGILTAEQRYRLFIQAEQKGYQRQAVLNSIDSEIQNETPVKTPEATHVEASQQNSIKEFDLAKSQFKNFTEQYLQVGNQVNVISANLLADGKVQLIVGKDGQTEKTVTGIISDLTINPHQLSDQWIRIAYQDGSMSEPVILNTRDDFPSVESATAWMDQANNKIGILEKLTEVVPIEKETRIAGAPSPEQDIQQDEIAQKEPSTPDKIDEKDKEKDDVVVVVDEQLGQKAVGSNGKIVIASNDNPIKTQETPSDTPKITQEVSVNTPKITRETPADTPKITQEVSVDTPKITKASLDDSEETGNTLTGFDAPSADEACRQNVYVSFKFPDGENPISHYNITPPEGTIMIDNGDSTAYFTGSCIQGNYDFSYVYIKEAKQQKNWKHFEREGAFQLASNSEQCSIDLNTPEKSASLECF